MAFALTPLATNKSAVGPVRLGFLDLFGVCQIQLILQARGKPFGTAPNDFSPVN